MTLRIRRFLSFAAGLVTFYVACVFLTVLVFGYTSFPNGGWLSDAVESLYQLLERHLPSHLASYAIVLMLVTGPGLLGLVAQLLLSGRTRVDDGHLHCLKCGYILKGLTVPRCPECGEPI